MSELSAESKSLFNRIMQGCGCLESTRLELDRQQASLSFMLYPEEKGFRRDPESRRLVFKGLSSLRIWAPALPPELATISQPGPEFLGLMASLFREQWIYDWECFTEPSLAAAPAWSWQADASAEAAETFAVYLELPGQPEWVLSFRFSGLLLETPLETEQSLNDFVAGWRQLAD